MENLTKIQKIYVNAWDSFYEPILKEISDDNLKMIAPFINLKASFAYCTTGEKKGFEDELFAKMKKEWEKLKSKKMSDECGFSICNVSTSIQTLSQWEILIRVDTKKQLCIYHAQFELLLKAVQTQDMELFELVLSYGKMYYGNIFTNKIVYTEQLTNQNTLMYYLFKHNDPKEQKTKELVKKIYDNTYDSTQNIVKGDVYGSLFLTKQWKYITEYEKLFV